MLQYDTRRTIGPYGKRLLAQLRDWDKADLLDEVASGAVEQPRQ